MKLLLLMATLASPLVPRTPAPEAIATHQELGAPDFTSPEAGFSIDKPAADWTLTTKPGPFGVESLQIDPPEAAGAVRFSIQISAVGTSGERVAEERRDAVLDQIKSMDTVHDQKPIELTVAGRAVPGLQLDQEASGQLFHLRQAYLVENGLLYKFQFHAPQADFEDRLAAFEQALDSFELLSLDAASRAKMNLKRLAARCGSQVLRHDQWDAAAQQARDEGKLIVATVQAVSGFDINDGIARGPLMDPDVVALLQSRFVVLRWRKGMGAPFEQHQVFGLGPSTFGTGMLVVDPEGHVLRQIYVLDGTAVYDVLVEVLEELPGVAGPEPHAEASPVERIEWSLRTGQLERAQQLLATEAPGAQDPRTAKALADLHRLRREGPEALAAVERALEGLAASQTAGQELQDECRLLQARLFTSTGEALQAESLVDALLAASPAPSPKILAELQFLKGALRLQAEDRAGCEGAWGTLIEEHPDSPWSWLAAAAIGSPLWQFDLYPDLRWPDPADRRLIELPRPRSAKKGKPTTQSMIQEAADYLLGSQREDGSWVTSSAYGDRDPLGDDFDLAATAIASRALLRLEGNRKARAAAERGLAWLLERRRRLEQMEGPPVVFMDYAVWSRSYGVFFLADCLEAEMGEAEDVRGLLSLYLKDLIDRQQPNGGWSYYLSGKAGAEALPQSISFTTATVVMALERAVALDFELPERALERGLNCLEAMRSPHDTFGYFLNGRSVESGQRSADGVEASAARGPACSLALIRGEREDVRDLATRLELYVDHIGTFGAERRKALMHAGAHTQGSHYLLYDFSTAAEALADPAARGLKRKLAKRTRQAILAELRACQNQDGSYVDNPLIGADVGTGLALQCLLDLTR